MPLGHASPSGPTALLVSRDPGRLRDTATVLGQRGVRIRFAHDDHGVTRALAHRPWLVLVDLTDHAPLSDRTIAHINRMRGHALVVALHSGSIESAGHALADLSVDGFCRADERGHASLASYTDGSTATASPTVH